MSALASPPFQQDRKRACAAKHGCTVSIANSPAPARWPRSEYYAQQVDAHGDPHCGDDSLVCCLASQWTQQARPDCQARTSQGFNGNLTWEMGQESGTQKMKDGKEGPIDYITTNVYEKIGGRWFTVSTTCSRSRNN
jgi:hypothetical protein